MIQKVLVGCYSLTIDTHLKFEDLIVGFTHETLNEDALEMSTLFFSKWVVVLQRKADDYGSILL